MAVAAVDSVPLAVSVTIAVPAPVAVAAVSVTAAVSAPVARMVSVCLIVSCKVSYNEVRRARSRKGPNAAYSLDDCGWLFEGLGNHLSLEISRGYNSRLRDDCSLRLRDLLDPSPRLYNLRFDGPTSDSGRDWQRLGLDTTHQSGSIIKNCHPDLRP